MSKGMKLVWIVILVIAALVALAILLVTVGTTDKATAAQPKVSVSPGTVVPYPAFTTQQLVSYPVLKGPDARDQDSASVSANCGSLWKARAGIETDALTGRLYTTHYSQGWCFKGGHITWVGPMRIWGDKGNAGYETGIDFHGSAIISNNWFKWGANDHADGGHATTGRGDWWLCFSLIPPLQGEVCPVKQQKFGKILVFSNGHYEFYRP